MQGDDEKYLRSAACAKHFAVHSGPESERHSFNAVVSKKDLRETYLPAFKEAVKEANVEAIMGAYNRTNGEPCCGSKTLLDDILRNEWDFKGHVTSDCWAIKDFHEGHGITSNAVESVALAVNNGCDLNCGNMYLNLYLAYKEGYVTEETIDKSVIRLMNTRMKIGMFDELLNEAVKINLPYIVMMFHSSELMPGCSIYRTDDDSIEELYDLLENFFIMLHDKNIDSVTLTEAANSCEV